ncbi:MAG TPA: transglutaminase domain-containing protein [Caulobacteraceae bacterium]|nr:transglutaminase domain-containing protein [Caulobacteraceae bacterium]
MSPASRRLVLQTGFAAAIAGPRAARAEALAPTSRFSPAVGPWRRFEVTTEVTIANPKGEVQLWLPAPTLDTGFQRDLGSRWTGNAASSRLVTDGQSGARMLHAAFAAGEASPTLSLTSTVETRGRLVDWSKPSASAQIDPTQRRDLAPTRLQPVDGVVLQTALAATVGATTDVEKTRAIYAWVISNCFRDPSVRGCGAGKIEAMLTSGNLGGKCADLNALFAAMCRSVGVPAREIYGVRLAPSAFGYHQLGADPANLTGAQHCRAEVWLTGYGWVAMDPADVLKVMRQERADWIKDARDPLVAPVYAGLFGGWEGNWVGWNAANDVSLPGSRTAAQVPFLMYPQAEDERGRFDDLAANTFRYAISAREVA